MENPIILGIFVVFFIFVCIIIFYLRDSVIAFNRQFTSILDSNEKQFNQLVKFQYDITFKNPPEEIVIENQYDCTPEILRPCRLNDSSKFCAGCKNLLATCVHFDTDQKFIDSTGKEGIIPANTDPNDGYCLLIKTISEACNPFHGDLVLVSLTPENYDSFLICECKNPGFIGKMTISGACDTPFICNGKIDNIDQPLEDIKCLCPDLQVSAQENSIPTCIIPAVKDFKEWDKVPEFEAETLPFDYFDSVIATYYTGKIIKNPCKYCAITGVPVNGEVKLVTQDGEKAYVCISQDTNCVPIRLSQQKRILLGKNGPDGMIALQWNSFNWYGKTKDPDFDSIAVLFSPKDSSINKTFLNYILAGQNGYDETKMYALDLRPHQVRIPGHFANLNMRRVPIGLCTNFWPGYICELYAQSTVGNSINLPTGNNQSLLLYSGREAPGSFLWGKEIWNTVETQINIVCNWEIVDGVVAVKFNPFLRGFTQQYALKVGSLFLHWEPFVLKEFLEHLYVDFTRYLYNKNDKFLMEKIQEHLETIIKNPKTISELMHFIDSFTTLDQFKQILAEITKNDLQVSIIINSTEYRQYVQYLLGTKKEEKT